MEQTWRWFGPDDVVTLAQARQAGARGIVNALHQIPYGVVWEVEEIEKRKAIIEADKSLGLRWSVVEGDLETIFANYRQSLRNLAACGIDVVCYNFMPVLDWTRTDLAQPLPGGGTALRFNLHEYVVVDHFMLQRPGADEGHSAEVMDRAKAWFERSSEADRARLMANIMAGLPGAYDRYDVPGLKRILARYADMSHDGLRANLKRFLEAVIPTAEEVGIRMCIHPDDPPRTTSPSSSARSTALRTGSPCAPARSAPIQRTTCRPSPAASPTGSGSRICAMSPRTRTAPSWRPSISAATPTWSPWSTR